MSNVTAIDGGKSEAKSDETKSLIIKSEIKRFIKDKDGLTAGDFADALNEKVTALIDSAIVRAQKNGRKLVRPYDL
jgi:hypothetical protein